MAGVSHYVEIWPCYSFYLEVKCGLRICICARMARGRLVIILCVNLPGPRFPDMWSALLCMFLWGWFWVRLTFKSVGFEESGSLSNMWMSLIQSLEGLYWTKISHSPSKREFCSRHATDSYCNDESPACWTVLSDFRLDSLHNHVNQIFTINRFLSIYRSYWFCFSEDFWLMQRKAFSDW